MLSQIETLIRDSNTFIVGKFCLKPISIKYPLNLFYRKWKEKSIYLFHIVAKFNWKFSKLKEFCFHVLFSSKLDWNWVDWLLCCQEEKLIRNFFQQQIISFLPFSNFQVRFIVAKGSHVNLISSNCSVYSHVFGRTKKASSKVPSRSDELLAWL